MAMKRVNQLLAFSVLLANWPTSKHLGEFTFHLFLSFRNSSTLRFHIALTLSSGVNESPAIPFHPLSGDGKTH